jgi:Holliday junction resolvasome RuvABC endonuclease subunit
MEDRAMKGLMCVGADPGFAHLGVGTLLRDGGGWHYVASQHVETTPRDSDDERMRVLWKWLELVNGDLFVYESQDDVLAAMHRLEQRNARSDLVRDVIGLFRARAFSCGAELVSVTPREMRQAMNLPAQATKHEMRHVLQQIVKDLPPDLSLHATDALVAAITGERKWRACAALNRGRR